MSNWDYTGLRRRQLKAIGYLASLPNYRVVKSDKGIVLEHWGEYGWCSGGSYKKWEEVASHIWGVKK